MLLTGWGATSSAGERIAPFKLVDQHGQAVALDNSGQHTLISFYNLTFPILSDSDGETLKALDMWDERYKISKYGFTLIDGRLAVLGHRAGPWSPSSEVKAYFLRRVAESASEETSGG